MRTIFRRLFFLVTSNTPIQVWMALLPSAIRERRSRADGTKPTADFRRSLNGMTFSSFWFEPHIPVWSEIFRGKSRQVEKILEIGSWEGVSAVFFAHLFPLSTITAVDTWDGSEENEGVPADLQQRFERNTATIANRLEAFRGFSSEYFCQNVRARFDLIYVDGSHDAQDVLMDGLAGWNILNPGGYMVFDDYMWFFYKERRRNPGWAINAFLHLVSTDAEVIHAGYQVFVRKKINAKPASVAAWMNFFETGN